MRRGPLLLLGALILPASLRAQLQVTGVRNLAFGPVIQGVPNTVAANEAVRSGEFEVIATLGNRLRVRFTLPNRLNGPAGATLNLSFSNSDGLALETGPGATPQTFNPHGNRTFTLVTGNRLLLFLGGQVSPTANQTTGAYTNTVTLTVTII